MSVLRIVVGVDGSEDAARALRWAYAEAVRWDAPIEVVHAWVPPYPIHPGDLFEDEGPMAEAARELLAAVVARAGRETLAPADVRQTTVVAHAAPALVAAAQDADLLVVGSRGLGGVKGLMLGSVSQHCVQSAVCPVVVVPRAQ